MTSPEGSRSLPVLLPTQSSTTLLSTLEEYLFLLGYVDHLDKNQVSPEARNDLARAALAIRRELCARLLGSS